MRKPRVLLADDHKMLAEGLRALLEPDFEFVGIAEDGHALLDMAEAENPDVIVADITMPSLNGLDAVEQLQKRGSRAKVVFLTMHHDAQYAVRAFEAGASGFVLKHSASEELLQAIREVLRGGTYVTSILAKEVMEIYRNGKHEEKNPIRKLTSRQREVLQLVAEGNSAKEVAARLHISARTVEFHKYQIMEALGARTSAELVQVAIKYGLISI